MVYMLLYISPVEVNNVDCVLVCVQLVASELFFSS
uniref:Uncharacterized protein n=1 Tax=Arundo donax TaxID=35708 RepID=A0A0A9DP45_ARUDO